MFLADKNAEQLQEMIDRRKEQLKGAKASFVLQSEIDELQTALSELLRFAPGTLVLDPETGLAYRRRPSGGYSVFHIDGAAGVADVAPENVQIIWAPESGD